MVMKVIIIIIVLNGKNKRPDSGCSTIRCGHGADDSFFEYRIEEKRLIRILSNIRVRRTDNLRMVGSSVRVSFAGRDACTYVWFLVCRACTRVRLFHGNMRIIC